jgi:hypothetical protein
VAVRIDLYVRTCVEGKREGEGFNINGMWIEGWRGVSVPHADQVLAHCISY